jgi:hypothetical protein
MEYHQAAPPSHISKRVVAYIASVVVAGGALGGYAVHEHRTVGTASAIGDGSASVRTCVFTCTPGSLVGYKAGAPEQRREFAVEEDAGPA